MFKSMNKIKPEDGLLYAIAVLLRTAESAGCMYFLSNSNGELCSRIVSGFLRWTER